MPVSLSAKLRDLRRTLRPKFSGPVLFDLEQLKLIARHMPRTDEALRALIPSHLVDAYGKQILSVTTDHARDPVDFEECVKEIGAFARGGLPGMDCLNRVYTQILKHFKLEDDAEDVLEACKLYMNQETRLKRKRTDDEDEPQHSHHTTQ